MGASRESYITMVNSDGELRNQAKNYYYKWKESVKKIEELEFQVATLEQELNKLNNDR